MLTPLESTLAKEIIHPIIAYKGTKNNVRYKTETANKNCKFPFFNWKTQCFNKI